MAKRGTERRESRRTEMGCVRYKREGEKRNLFGAETVKNHKSMLQKYESSCKVRAYSHHSRVNEPRPDISHISNHYSTRSIVISLIFMQIALKVLSIFEFSSISLQSCHDNVCMMYLIQKVCVNQRRLSVDYMILCIIHRHVCVTCHAMEHTNLWWE